MVQQENIKLFGYAAIVLKLHINWLQIDLLILGTWYDRKYHKYLLLDMCSFYRILPIYNIFYYLSVSKSAKSNLRMCLFWKNYLITDVIYKERLIK